MKNFSKFSKILIASALLSTLPYAYAADDLPENPEFCGGKEAKIAIVHPRAVADPEHPHSVVLEEGESFKWKIRNVSIHDARKIQLHSDLADDGKIAVENFCGDVLRPGKDCEIKTTAISGGEGIVDFEGCNTNPVAGFLTINGGHQLVIGEGDDTCFNIDEKHTQILLTNLGEHDITFTSNDVRFDGLKDVKVSDYYTSDDNCKLAFGKWTVPAGRNNICTLPLEAGRKAHNIDEADGKIFINYHVKEERKEAEGCVNVAKIKVSINDGREINLPTGSEELLAEKDVVVRNESEFFAWQDPEIEFDVGTTEHVDFEVRECRFEADSDDDSVAPGDCLIVKFKTKPDSKGKGELLAFGSNINPNPTSEVVNVGDVTITLASDDEQKLQAQKIIVSNNFARGPVRVKSVTWSDELEGKIKLCGQYDFTCINRSDCDDELHDGEYCSLWVEAIGGNGNLQALEGDIKVVVESAHEGKDHTEWFAEFEADRDTSLYVTGFFNRAGNTVEAYNIVSWNGTEWDSLATGLRHGEGRALEIFQGNLAVGGVYASADNVPNTTNLSFWNGSAWVQFGTEDFLAPNRPVNSLLALNNFELAIAGDFTGVAGVAANHIALWDGAAFTALGGLANNGTDGPIKDMDTHLDGLYFAGDFDRVGAPAREDARARTKAHNVAGYVGLDWVKLGHRIFNGTNRTAYAIFAANDNDLYVAGAFTRVFGNRKLKPPHMPVTRAHHIANWTGGRWETVGKNHHAINGTIRDITSFHDTLFIGGNFDNSRAGLRYVAFLNGATGEWNQAGVAIDGTVNNLLPSGDRLYAGGHFGANGGLFNNIAYLDRVNTTTNWKPVDFAGGGITSTYSAKAARVNAMLVADSLTLSSNSEW